jgi:hypothetical protein
MVNAHSHHDLLKWWEDVIWYYKRVKLDAKSSHCIHLVFISIKTINLILQNPMDFIWDSTNKEIHQMLLETT